jgi:hypothetical protein
MNFEEFKNIPYEHCQHYLINREGIVINSKTGRKLKPNISKGIYERLQLFGDDKKSYKPYTAETIWFVFGFDAREEYLKKIRERKEILELQELEKELNNIQK